MNELYALSKGLCCLNKKSSKKCYHYYDEEEKVQIWERENLHFTKILCQSLHFSLQIILIFQGSRKPTADLTHDSEIIVMELYYKYLSVLFDIYLKKFYNVLAQLF